MEVKRTRSRMIRPVSLSRSYYFLLPLGISMTAMKPSGVMRLGLMSCQMFATTDASFI